MAPRYVYYVYDKETEELVVSGSAKECAEAIGVHTATIQGAGLGTAPMRNYFVEREPYCGSNEIRRLAAQWDAFCEPIRKRYGIKVKKEVDTNRKTSED